jgi:transposase
MDQHTIFSATLGLHRPWEILNIDISEKEKRMDIAISVADSSNFTCPTCGKIGEMCDVASEMWRHDSFFSYTTYLHVRVPVVTCPCCGVCKIEHPWSRIGSRFVRVTGDESVHGDSVCMS